MVSAYLGLCSQIDNAIGVILAELDRLGQRDNTIIVYAADHGDYAGEHGLWEKGGGISYSAIARIPLVVWTPDMPRRGREASQLVEAVDLFPTLCELAAVDTPDTVQGRSFASIVTGESDEPIRETALTENAGRKAIATDRWRFIANRGDQPDQLFDQHNDPWELENRIDDPACADVARDLQRKTARPCGRRPTSDSHDPGLLARPPLRPRRPQSHGYTRPDESVSLTPPRG